MGITLSFKEAPPIAIPSDRVEIEFNDEPELTPIEEDEETKRQKKIKKTLQQQVVEQNRQINEEIDENAIFLSAFNQKVLQQTRAEQSGKFKNTPESGQKSAGDKTGKKTFEELSDLSELSKEPGELPKLKELTPKFSLEPGPQHQLEKDGNPSQTDDYMKDVQKGMQTLLSTREFVYYSYYNRIKEALRQHWEPNVREKVKIIYRQGRSIASAQDRVTQVLVILDKNGDLIKVEVLTQSGVPDLDNAAMEAFRSAAPFPNPPKGMVESDGTIKIRWDFVLEA